MSRRAFSALVLVVGLGVALPAAAVPQTVMVGDNDGYGAGIPDNGNLGAFATPNTDNRSAAEAAATNGAQITDVYSAIFPPFGPNAFTTASVLMPFSGVLLSATLTIDMGDFQSSTFGAISANINGIPLAFAFDDGFTNSVVRDFTLSPAMVAAANASGQVTLNLDRGASGDFIAFDFFRLNADVPEPGTLLLLGAALFGLGFGRRRQAA